MTNHYQLLGISETASKEEIKSAFKQLALQLHPDKNPHNPAAEELFKQINAAYQVLSHDEKRAVYDAKRHYASAVPPYTYAAADESEPYSSSNPHASSRTYQRSAYAGRRPQYAARVEYEPVYIRKMALLFGLFLVVFIAGAVWFFHAMNRWSAEESYQEALLEGKSYTAMHKLSEAIAFDEEFWQAYYKRGELRMSALGDYDHAYNDFSAAIHYAETPTSSMYYNRGLCSLQLENYAKAVKDFTESIRLNPRNGMTYYLRGLAYASLQQAEQACQDWQKAVDSGITLSDDSLGEYCR